MKKDRQANHDSAKQQQQQQKQKQQQQPQNKSDQSRSNRNDRRKNGGTNANANNLSSVGNNDQNGRDPAANGAASPEDFLPYPPYYSLSECMKHYMNDVDLESNNNNNNNNNNNTRRIIIRGKLRVLPSTMDSGWSFVTCDRGRFRQDVVIEGALERNRAMDGDIVFVEIDGPADHGEKDTTNLLGDSVKEHEGKKIDVKDKDKNNNDDDDDDDEAGDNVSPGWNKDEIVETTWADDGLHMNLWNPILSDIPRKQTLQREFRSSVVGKPSSSTHQYKGRVVHICPPKALFSELEQPGNNHGKTVLPRRRIVGTFKILPGKKNTNDSSNTTNLNPVVLLTPNNRSLPQFKCPNNTYQKLNLAALMDSGELAQSIFQAEYEFLSWGASHKWPKCVNVSKLGEACVLEDEIQALLTGLGVNHGEFDAEVLKEVDNAVREGLYVMEPAENSSSEGTTTNIGWKPTQSMYKGRRDYRHQRIFTIDPTTAKDLDDALHIRMLEDGKRVEIGVHIADVSYFVRPDTPVDRQAQLRSTTVYLVDRTVPMLPRPLCEVACSLNENVERLAFSCVWTMNVDGTLSNSGKDRKHSDVWYGRTVIKSCARLDYATAQNIIDKKCATGEAEKDLDESLWPRSRRPAGGHTIDEVAADIRLMHRVAMARRKLRFDSGALALHASRLAFQLDVDGQTPLLAAPYPIRDSNRLIEEYMLLANFLVAQRLITHARDLAVLRNHGEPKILGLEAVVVLAKQAIDFDIDVSSSQRLHSSLAQLSRQCDSLLLQCVTNLIMTPMVAAKYFVAGTLAREEWRHYALNIPYYTHFTSPIRRYPDVLVHRLLQATLDGEDAVQHFPRGMKVLQTLCDHSNDMKIASKDAQERCDRVFLSLYVKKNPLVSQMGVVLSVGRCAFTVYVPAIESSALLYLQEHGDQLTYASEKQRDGTLRILLQQKPASNVARWNTFEVKVFAKVVVTVVCKDIPPIDIKLKFERPWTG